LNNSFIFEALSITTSINFLIYYIIKISQCSSIDIIMINHNKNMSNICFDPII